MTRMQTVGLGLIAALIAVSVWVYNAVDWYSYGVAKPPLTEETPNTSEVVTSEVQIGGVRVDNQLSEFSWSQMVPISISAKAVPEMFRWPLPPKTLRTMEAIAAHAKKYQHLPRASFRIQFVRRSSLGNGFVVAWELVAGASPERNGETKFEDQVWIPHVPGTCSVRILLSKTLRKSNGKRDVTESLVGTFPLTVVPPKPVPMAAKGPG